MAKQSKSSIQLYATGPPVGGAFPLDLICILLKFLHTSLLAMYLVPLMTIVIPSYVKRMPDWCSRDDIIYVVISDSQSNAVKHGLYTKIQMHVVY